MTHTHAQRHNGQQGTYSRQVLLAVQVINVYVNTERGAPYSRNVISAHPQCRQRPRQEGSEGRRQREGIHTHTHTTREKINAICLSHHAFPKHISACLSPRQKLYWGTLSYCPLVSPSSRLCSPNRTSLQSSTVYINISHARISEQSTILINVSCFSAPPVQGIIQTKGLRDVQGMCVCVGGVLIGIQINDQRHGQAVRVTFAQLMLSLSRRLTSSLETGLFLGVVFQQSLCRFFNHCCSHCSFSPHYCKPSLIHNPLNPQISALYFNLAKEGEEKSPASPTSRPH